MSEHRFFFPQLAKHSRGDTIFLEDAEAHHLSAVLRVQKEEEVELMDGKGSIAQAKVLAFPKKTVELRLGAIEVFPEPQGGLILAVAWGKAARRSYVVEKAVEFGAKSLWFWQAARSNYPLPKSGDVGQGSLLAGAKQCRNPFLPELLPLKSAKAMLEKVASLSADMPVHKHLLVEADHEGQLLGPQALAQQGYTVAIIGPEGGLTPEEVALFTKQGFQAYSMGKSVLRVESAALLVLGLHFWAKNCLL